MQILSYTEYRLAKREGEIVQQERNKTTTMHTKWWNPFYLEHTTEYTEWEDIPFPEAE